MGKILNTHSSLHFERDGPFKVQQFEAALLDCSSVQEKNWAPIAGLDCQVALLSPAIGAKKRVHFANHELLHIM